MLPSLVVYYYRRASMTGNAWEELQWWWIMLQNGVGVPVQVARPALLVSLNGGSSGTGTGYTIQFDSLNMPLDTPDGLDKWMGI